jgi:peptidoglycan/LPS O-acetylase OafA/YrhL
MNFFKLNRQLSNSASQLDPLDGLRGFAALLVVVSHASIKGMFPVPAVDLRGLGRPGVYLFFLLSAFLLTLALLRKSRSLLSAPVMINYWLRRFLRIYPLYILYLLFAVVCTKYVDPSKPIIFALDVDGFMNHLLLQEGKDVTWSIAVEFKFYFVLPVLTLLFSAVSSRSMKALVGSVTVVLVALQLFNSQIRAFSGDTGLSQYMTFFVLGMLLAVIQFRMGEQFAQKENANKLMRVLGYLGLAGIVIMTPVVYSKFGAHVHRTHFHNQHLLYGVCWSAVLMAAVNVPGGIQKFFSMPVLRFYGALSFGVYLFHPVFVSLAITLGIGLKLGFWFVLASSTICAFVAFKTLEQPLSKIGVGRTNPPVS